MDLSLEFFPSKVAMNELRGFPILVRAGLLLAPDSAVQYVDVLKGLGMCVL